MANWWDSLPDAGPQVPQTQATGGGKNWWDDLPDAGPPQVQFFPKPQSPLEQAGGSLASMMARPFAMAGEALATGVQGMQAYAQTPEGQADIARGAAKQPFERSMTGEVGAGLGRGTLGVIDAGIGASALVNNMNPFVKAASYLGFNPVEDAVALASNHLQSAKQSDTLRPSDAVGQSYEKGWRHFISDPRWWAGSASEQVPQIAAQFAAAYFTGGGTAAGQVGAFSIAGGGQAAGQFKNDSFRRLEQKYLEEGQSESEARRNAGQVSDVGASVVGIATAAIDTIPGAANFLSRNPAVSKFIQGSMGSKLASFMGTGVGKVATGGTKIVAEGVSEVAQEAVSDAIRGWIEKDPKAFQDMTDPDKAMATMLMGMGSRAAVSVAEKAGSRLSGPQGGQQPTPENTPTNPASGLQESNPTPFPSPSNPSLNEKPTQQIEQVSANPKDTTNAPPPSPLSPEGIAKAVAGNREAAQAYAENPSRSNLEKLIGQSAVDLPTSQAQRQALRESVRAELASEEPTVDAEGLTQEIPAPGETVDLPQQAGRADGQGMGEARAPASATGDTEIDANSAEDFTLPSKTSDIREQPRRPGPPAPVEPLAKSPIAGLLNRENQSTDFRDPAHLPTEDSLASWVKFHEKTMPLAGEIAKELDTSAKGWRGKKAFSGKTKKQIEELAQIVTEMRLGQQRGADVNVEDPTNVPNAGDKTVVRGPQPVAAQPAGEMRVKLGDSGNVAVADERTAQTPTPSSQANVPTPEVPNLHEEPTREAPEPAKPAAPAPMTPIQRRIQGNGKQVFKATGEGIDQDAPTLYHGGPENIERFDVGKTVEGKRSVMGPAIYFDEQKQLAENWVSGRHGGGRVYEAKPSRDMRVWNSDAQIPQAEQQRIFELAGIQAKAEEGRLGKGEAIYDLLYSKLKPPLSVDGLDADAVRKARDANINAAHLAANEALRKAGYDAVRGGMLGETEWAIINPDVLIQPGKGAPEAAAKVEAPAPSLAVTEDPQPAPVQELPPTKPGLPKNDSVFVAAINGDNGPARDNAITHLYERYVGKVDKNGDPVRGKLWKYAAKQVGDADADDVAQDVFTKFLKPESLASFDPAKGNLQNYLFGMAKNAITEVQRARGKAAAGDEAIDSGRPTREVRKAATKQAETEEPSFDINKLDAELAAKPRYKADEKGLIQAARDLDPDFVGNLVSIRDLRAKMNLPKGEFNRLVKKYVDGERAYFSEHDYPASLTPEERAQMIQTDQGLQNGIIFNDPKKKLRKVGANMTKPDKETMRVVREQLGAKVPSDPKSVRAILDSIDEIKGVEYENVDAWNNAYNSARKLIGENMTDDIRRHGLGRRQGRDYAAAFPIDEAAQAMATAHPEFISKDNAEADLYQMILTGRKDRPDTESVVKSFIKRFMGDEAGAVPADFAMNMLATLGRGAKSVALAFHPSGKLAGEGDFVRQAMYQRDAAISGMMTEYEFAHRDLEAALKVDPSKAEAVNNALGDSSLIAKLPTDLQAPVRKVREIIDALTDRAIATGNIQGRLKATFERNKGLYMHQQYRKFERPEWVSEIDEPTWNQVVAEMKTDPQFAGIPETELRKLAYNLASGDISNNSILDIVKSRKNPAKWTRTLFGLETDPLLNSAETVRRMSTLIANMEMWNQIGAEGEKAGAFTNDLFAKQGYSTPLAGQETSIVKQGVEGLFTTKEVKDEIEKLMNPQGLMNSKNKLVKAVGMVFSLSSASKTIGSVGTQINNFASSGVNFLAKHGASAASDGFRKDMADTLRIMAQRGIGGRYAVPTGAEKVRLEALAKEMADGGIFADSPTAHMLSDAARIANDSKLMRHPVAKQFAKIFGVPAEMYAAGDQFWKVADYLATKRDLLDAGLPEAEARAMAADRANRHNQSYKRHGQVQKTLAQLPFLGGIGAMYQFDQPRMLTQRVVDAVKDIKSGNPKLRAKAIKHLAGIVMVNAGIPAVLALAARLAYGITKKEEDEARKLMAPWDQNAQLVTLGRDADGNPRMFNVGRWVPMGGMMKMITALSRGEPVDALMEGASPILNPKLPSEAGIDIVRNQTAAGKPVYNPEDTLGNQAQDAGLRVLQAFTPGSLDSAVRVYKSITDPSGETGRKYNTGDEVAGFFGARPVTVDVRKALEFKAREYKARMQNAARLLTDPARKGGDLADAHANMERARQAIFDDLAGQLQAGKTVMANSSKPITTGEATALLQGGGLGKQESQDVANGIHKVHSPDVPGLKPAQQAEVARLAEETAKAKGGETIKAFNQAQDKELIQQLRALSAPKPQPPKRSGESAEVWTKKRARAIESLNAWQANREEALQYVAARGLNRSDIQRRYAVELKGTYKGAETRAEHAARLRKALGG